MQKLVSATFWAFALVFIVYIGVSVIPSEYLPSADRERILSGSLIGMAGEAWSFAKPLLQLAFIILIFEYVINKFKTDSSIINKLLKFGDVKSVLALMVVGAFCVAGLAGSPYVGDLKDAALVVIGFYFGRILSDNKPESNNEA